jgi:hypothetical protein
MVTAQLLIALAWCQRHAGISTPLLEFPATTLPHLEKSFFPSLRTYLASTKSALILENSQVSPLQRTGDFHLWTESYKVINSPADKFGKSSTAVSSSKYAPSLTWLQLSELKLTSPSSVVSPVCSPENKQNMKSDKNVRTPPPDT